MKIAILADIHGNLPALEAVTEDIDQWSPDLVILNGDVVNRGPRNRACLAFVKRREREAGWILLRGNHEDYVLATADPEAPRTGPEAELRRFSDWTSRQLGDGIYDLFEMPDRWGWRAPDGSRLVAMHGSVLGNRVGVYPWTTDEELRQRIAPGPDLFVTAHTHRPLMRSIDQSLVVNVGSAGMPFDDNPLASYGRFTWRRTQGWAAEIRRLAYDRRRAERDMVTTGFLDEAGPFAKLVLVELRMARGLIYRWAKRYQEAFFEGEVSLEGSVEAFLDADVYRPYLKRPR